MDKIKDILKEKTTWGIGVPSLIVGVMTLLDADNAQQVASTVSTAGQAFVETNDWKTSVGFLLAGLLGIFMKTR